MERRTYKQDDNTFCVTMRGIKASSQSTMYVHLQKTTMKSEVMLAKAAAFNGNTKERTKAHEYKTIF